jgi:hypothetical protein
MGRAYGLRRPRYSCTCAPRALSFRVTPFSASRLALLRAKRSRDEIAFDLRQSVPTRAHRPLMVRYLSALLLKS